jgi:molybdopterin-guanine dinucleotide biosynthesis protein B
MKFLGIIGYKKSGKTTLILRLSEELIKRGYKVAAIKHTSQDIDLTNSDTSKYKKYLSQVVAITPKESVIFLKGRNDLEEIIKFLDADIILVEGFKKEKTFPKIICLRKEIEKNELSDGLQICTASLNFTDSKSDFSEFDILNDADIKKIAEIAINKSFKLPNLNCEACGYQDCYGLAQEIVRGNKIPDDCLSLEPVTLVKVDGKTMVMNSFISKILSNTIIGMLSSLKGFTKGSIEIKIK